MMSEILGQHDLLLEAKSRVSAGQYARYFFEHNDLVRYEEVVIDSNTILCASDPQFIARLKNGLEANTEIITDLIEELCTENLSDLRSWPGLQQGYVTKLLHTVVHLLDGFFGIDSAMYNLVENSHLVSNALLNRMKEHPEKHWLVPVTGMSTRGDADRVPFLRPFGREDPIKR